MCDMSRNIVLGAVLAVVACVLLFGGLSLLSSPAVPPVVGADENTVPAAIGWSTLIGTIVTALGGGTFWAAAQAFWTKVSPFAAPIIHAVAPTLPVVLPNTNLNKDASDAVEFVQAAIAYQANKTDKAIQRRFIIASITEVSDVVGMESPQVASALNSLLTSIANEWAPAPQTT
jgi:hypothetical protein